MPLFMETPFLRPEAVSANQPATVREGCGQIDEPLELSRDCMTASFNAAA